MRYEFEFLGHIALVTDDDEPEGGGLWVNDTQQAGMNWGSRALRAEVLRLAKENERLIAALPVFTARDQRDAVMSGALEEADEFSHTWKLVADGHELAVERLPDGSIASSWGGKDIGKASHEQVLGAEVLRLAERVRELEAICTIREQRELRKDAEVAKHGRKAATLAAENRALKAESEEYQLFGGELVGRLGLDREDMEGKPDAVGNQILAVIDERMARLTVLEEENRRLREQLAQAEHVPGRVLAAVREGAEIRSRRATLESVLKGLYSEDESQQRNAIIASVEWMLKENTPPADDLRGCVVWHRHDGDLVKLVRVSEAEELVPGATISVSYNPHPEEPHRSTSLWPSSVRSLSSHRVSRS